MVKVFTTENSTYFITENKVYAVGNNKYGQLGLGDKLDRYIPTEIKSLENKNIIRIIGGQYHTFAINKNGNVYVFGFNLSGELGLGNSNNQFVPVKNNILNNFPYEEIKTAYFQNFLLINGKLYVWGSNLSGQLGLSDCEDRYIPTEVEFFSKNEIKIKNVYTGHSHNFATTTENILYVWGSNLFGELGLGENAEEIHYTPVELKFFRGIPIKDIKTNSNSTFVLTEDGKLYSFGYNGSGQLGLGHRNNINIPQRVIANNKSIEKIITGRESIIVVTTDGSFYGWGWNDFIKTKDFNDEAILLPIRLPQIEALNPVIIKRGYSSIFMQLKNGDIYVLGKNCYGELGLGHNNPVLSPTKLDLSFVE